MTIEYFTVTLCILIGLIYWIYWFLTKDFDYWREKNVPFLKPVFLFGSCKNELLNKETWFSFIHKCYVNFKSHGFGGSFFVKNPAIWVCDPNVIEKILVEDFSHFHDRWSKTCGDSPMANTLLFSKGEDWRNVRLKLASAFAPGKVRGMFHQILSSAENLLLKVSEDSRLQEEVNVESLTADFSTEVLVSCLCGVKMSNSKEATDFKRALDLMFKPSLYNSIATLLSALLPPKLLRCVGIKLAPQEALVPLTKVVKGILDHRKQSGVERNDVLQTMLHLKEEEENEDLVKEEAGFRFYKITHLLSYLLGFTPKRDIFFTEETIAAQILGFMMGGIKPIAVTLTFSLFEIAKSPLVQKKVQEDIDSALLKHVEWSLEALKDMTYLDQVIQETLRMYSFNPVLMRCVSRKYKIPGTDVTLDEEMQVFIPSDGLHKDPDLYPSPLEFWPERWEGNNYKSSSTFLPFGHGPRICISIRLAVLTIKLCLARVLRQHRVSVSKKMTLPIRFDKSEFFFKVMGGVWLEFKERNV